MSEGFCDVSVGSDDGDPVERYQSRMVTARKPHQCDECGRDIAASERHEYVSFKFNGAWCAHRFCLPCSEISREFSDSGRSFGTLWEDFEQNWYEGAHVQACINRLTTARAKAHMRDRWLEWKELTVPPPAIEGEATESADGRPSAAVTERRAVIHDTR